MSGPASSGCAVSIPASVSHELRTPLTSVLGYTELLLSGDAGDLTARQRAMLDAVDRNAQRLERFVEDLEQLFDRTTSVPGEVGVQCLGALAVEALATHQEQISSRSLHVVLSADGPDVLVRADRRLQRAISHLVSNAVKFTPSGGEVRVEVTRVGRVAVVRVLDTGVGIPPDELPLVFDRFFRTSLAQRYATQGAGIGLSIAQEIIVSCGGAVEVRSERGRGTVATVRLPALRTPTSRSPQPM